MHSGGEMDLKEKILDSISKLQVQRYQLISQLSSEKILSSGSSVM